MVAATPECFFSVCDLSYISGMESRLSMHYHCDDVRDLSNDYSGHVDKIDVNVDSHVAIFWGFADAGLLKETPEFEQEPEEQEQELEEQISEAEHESKEQDFEEPDPEEQNGNVKTTDWARLQRRDWTRVQISPRKFQYTHPEVAQITTSMKKAFKIDMNRGVSRSKRKRE